MMRREEVSKMPTSPQRPHIDRALWQRAIRDVAPLQRREASIPTKPTASSDPSPTRDEQQHASPSYPSSALDRFDGIDRANAERLKRGLHKIEARLDLHGLTQTEAHQELAAFIGRSRAAGCRCVLIITGRGLGPQGPGVLKRAVPRWLQEPELRQHVLAMALAQPRHGGSGATYLLLRRLR